MKRLSGNSNAKLVKFCKRVVKSQLREFEIGSIGQWAEKEFHCSVNNASLKRTPEILEVNEI